MEPEELVNKAMHETRMLMSAARQSASAGEHNKAKTAAQTADSWARITAALISRGYYPTEDW